METKEETLPSSSFSLSEFFSDKKENLQNFFETKFNAMNICSAAMYILATTCVIVNLYVLLDRSIETIHYLRIYHLAVCSLMFSCGLLQLAFMWKAQCGAFDKLARPHTIPRPTMVSAFALTAGIALGYAYFLIFNIAFRNCDKLFDAAGAEEQWQEALYDLLMISFCVLSLVYIFQRYYMHKGLLNSAIISCASEFFPVMLVAHWLACGRAEQRADELIRRRQEKKSVRRMLQGMIGDVSKIYGLDPTAQIRRQLPALNLPTILTASLVILACITAFLASLRWFVGLYFAILFDEMHKKGSMTDTYSECAASLTQTLLFVLLCFWARQAITVKRFCPYHKAESKGDLVLIFGSASFMTVKLGLQLVELHFQRADGFLSWTEALLRTFSLTLIQASQWLQYLCLHRIMALHFEDVHATRRFLPIVALAAVVVNWVGFGVTFFETNTIKYQLGLEELRFSQSTLIIMIFTQTIYPADYLFCFTAAGCWTDVLLRYVEMGLFQLGPPMDLEELQDLEHQHHGRRGHSTPTTNVKRGVSSSTLEELNSSFGTDRPQIEEFKIANGDLKINEKEENIEEKEELNNKNIKGAMKRGGGGGNKNNKKNVTQISVSFYMDPAIIEEENK
uniref:Otopetrin-3 n=1 Tax=Meloidogyne hapla TaxID=6305 RepID=A0A1I8AYE3_MELHA